MPPTSERSLLICKAFAQVIWREATCLQIISVISDFQIIASLFINPNRSPKCCSKLLQAGVSLRGWATRLHHHVYFSKWGYNESRQCQLQRFVVGNSLQAALNLMPQSMSYVQTFRRLEENHIWVYSLLSFLQWVTVFNHISALPFLSSVHTEQDSFFFLSLSFLPSTDTNTYITCVFRNGAISGTVLVYYI